jgi:hypothetical protein
VIADRETFTELTVHLKRASDGLLRSAQHLAALARDPEAVVERDGVLDDRYAGALDELIAMAIELAAMERIFRAVMDANAAEDVAAHLGPKKASLPR